MQQNFIEKHFIGFCQETRIEKHKTIEKQTEKTKLKKEKMSKSEKNHVSIVVCGHVDAGKSTTTGRLIFELGGIPEREMQKLHAEAEKMNKKTFAYAFLMDKQVEERIRGVTIACATKEFFTESKHYTIIDAPGHADFIKNMITGASQADVALIMVPADGNFTTAIAKGNPKEGKIMGQTRQHALLINLLGVRQIIIGINKMDCDTAGYSQSRYEEVRDETRSMLCKVGWRKTVVQYEVPCLPISGYVGDNLIKPSENMPWWTGTDVRVLGDKNNVVRCHTLLDALEKMVQTPDRKVDAALRVPISGVFKIGGVGDVLTGRVEQGTVNKSDNVYFLPTHTSTNPCQGKVFSIEMHHKPSESAGPGDNVGMCIRGLDRSNMPRVGDIMVHQSETQLGRAARFTAQVQVLHHPGELKPGYCPIAYVRTSHSAVKMVSIDWKIGKETGGTKLENPAFIKAGDVAQVTFEPQQAFVLDTFKNCDGLGRVGIFEGNSVVMLGKVIDVVNA